MRSLLGRRFIVEVSQKTQHISFCRGIELEILESGSLT